MFTVFYIKVGRNIIGKLFLPFLWAKEMEKLSTRFFGLIFHESDNSGDNLSLEMDFMVIIGIYDGLIEI